MSDLSTSTPGTGSSAAIEREVETARAGIASTLDELRGRAAPGPLIEQALEYAKTSGGAEMLRNLGTAMRDNPLPLLMIGAGMGWLALTGTRHPNGHANGHGHADLHGHGYATNPVRSPLRTEGGLLGTSQGDASGEGLAQRAKDMAAGVRDSVTGTAGQMANSADSALRRVGDTASDMADRAGEAAGDLAHQARAQADHLAAVAQQGVGWMLREQPLVLGALGVAVGAAMGAMLPGTEAEDRLLGERRDALVERAGEVAQRGYERVREVAGRHVGDVREAAGEVAAKAEDKLGGAEGVAERGADAIVDVARGARQAVREAAHSLTEEARGMAEKPGGKPQEPRDKDENRGGAGGQPFGVTGRPAAMAEPRDPADRPGQPQGRPPGV